jgi:hypothetical protein
MRAAYAKERGVIETTLTAAKAAERQATIATRIAVAALLGFGRLDTEGTMSDRRELYRSPNGDTWFLGREPTSGHAFIIHQPNAPSGGRLSHIELGEFLRSGDGPEQKALLRLIATLVEVPPFA